MRIFVLPIFTSKFRIRVLEVCGCLLPYEKAVDLSRQTTSFEVFMEISVFSDLTPFVFLYKKRLFGGAGCLHLQGGPRTGMYCVISYKN